MGRIEFEERVCRKTENCLEKRRRLLERALVQEMAHAVHVALTLPRVSILDVLPGVLLLTLSRIGRPSTTPQTLLPFFTSQASHLYARAIFHDPRCPIAEGYAPRVHPALLLVSPSLANAGALLLNQKLHALRHATHQLLRGLRRVCLHCPDDLLLESGERVPVLLQ